MSISKSSSCLAQLIAVPTLALLLTSCGAGGGHIEKGKKLVEGKQFEQALSEFNAAIEEDPKNFYPYYGEAYIYANTGHPEQAFECANKALALKPDDANSLCVRGQALAEGNQPQAAITDLTKAMNLEPQKAKFVAMRSFIAATHGQMELAMQDSQKALELDPKSVPALISAAIVLDSQGNHDQAAATIQQAADIEPDNATVQKMEAMISQKQPQQAAQ